ncbi:hypothetical protein UMM65_12780 [Aureibaculum sp. 2210JD6-5]|uniref:hypothetical protein n=1 Tax=Aureibaculum sp. 2210JD6-5 TaxID=3103957 RepID=UPI002AACE363|nr:hypothetical protein [Aureibaculum sp. 2210JD6-5]MDY7396118.1 hypothetical protein [Aureibaculum sp. 2210JD6-5]
MKNIYWIFAGVLNLFTFFLHLIGGQIDLIDPMVESTLNKNKSYELIAIWHIITILLFTTSSILLLAGFNKKYSTNAELIKFIGYLNLLFCVPFIIASIFYGLFIPQWILFFPIGLLTIIGLKKQKIDA